MKVSFSTYGKNKTIVASKITVDFVGCENYDEETNVETYEEVPGILVLSTTEGEVYVDLLNSTDIIIED